MLRKRTVTMFLTMAVTTTTVLTAVSTASAATKVTPDNEKWGFTPAYYYDTTEVKIVELEKRYETTRDSIITQSVNADCVVFSEYISDYKNRLSSNNNLGATQDY